MGVNVSADHTGREANVVYMNDNSEAYELGYAHGRARASWMWNGNTTDETYSTFLRLYDEGDLPDTYLSPDPLSGEWAGESIPELLGDLFPQLQDDDADVDYWNSDILTDYEDGFRTGWYDELCETATYMTQPIPSHTTTQD